MGCKYFIKAYFVYVMNFVEVLSCPSIRDDARVSPIGLIFCWSKNALNVVCVSQYCNDIKNCHKWLSVITVGSDNIHVFRKIVG